MQTLSLQPVTCVCLLTPDCEASSGIHISARMHGTLSTTAAAHMHNHRHRVENRWPYKGSLDQPQNYAHATQQKVQAASCQASQAQSGMCPKLEQLQLCATPTTNVPDRCSTASYAVSAPQTAWQEPAHTNRWFIIFYVSLAHCDYSNR